MQIHWRLCCKIAVPMKQPCIVPFEIITAFALTPVGIQLGVQAQCYHALSHRPIKLLAQQFDANITFSHFKISKNVISTWFPHDEGTLFLLCCDARFTSRSSSGKSVGCLPLPRCSSASLWLKHDPWRVNTLYPLPTYPLVLYLYP